MDKLEGLLEDYKAAAVVSFCAVGWTSDEKWMKNG